MARFRRLLALGGLAAGAAAVVRRRRAAVTASPSGAAAPEPAPAPASAAGATAPSVAAAPPPPPEAPGPSVSPSGAGGSETERAEAADRTAPDTELLADRAGGPVDALVEQETSAAAAEAGRIGGRGGGAAGEDPAMAPVEEAGGGEAEGFEQAEADLVEAASHGDPAPDPTTIAFTPELESDEATARYGEPDEEDVTEVIRDPRDGGADDPGEGPGLASER